MTVNEKLIVGLVLFTIVLWLMSVVKNGTYLYAAVGVLIGYGAWAMWRLLK